MLALRTVNASAVFVAVYCILGILLSYTSPAIAFLVPSSCLSVRRAVAGWGDCGGVRFAGAGGRDSSALFGIKKKVDLEENYSGKIVDATDLGGMMGGMMGDPNAMFEMIEKNKKKAAEAAAALAAAAAISGAGEGVDQDEDVDAEAEDRGQEGEQAVTQ